MFGGGLHHPDVLVGKAVASRKAGKMFLIPRNGQIQGKTLSGQLRLRNSNQRFCSHKKKHFYAWIFVLACGWRQWQHQTTLETQRLNTRHQITLKKPTIANFFSLNFCQAWGRDKSSAMLLVLIWIWNWSVGKHLVAQWHWSNYSQRRTEFIARNYASNREHRHQPDRA